MADDTTSASGGGDIVEIPTVVTTTDDEGNTVHQGYNSGGYGFSESHGGNDEDVSPPIF